MRYHDEEKTRALTDRQHRCHQIFKVGNYTEQKDLNPTRAEGTCEWALQSSEYIRWTDSNHKDLLWISADPGCGKSVLARSIIDSYMSTPAVTVCYFFFKENEEQNCLATALCSILHQLFTQKPYLLHHAVPSWEINGKALQKDTHELWQIFLKATSNVSSKTICVFDAFDECREVDQDQLIQNLKSFHHQTHQPRQTCQPPNDSQTAQDTWLKFIVTSRPYQHIQNRFREITDFPYLHLMGEQENDKIRQEIDLVVKMRVDQLAKTASLPSDLQKRLEKQLLEMKHRTYLWLHLALDDIRATFENSLSPAEESIQMIPPSVDEAYEKILSRIPSGQMNTVKKIFQIILAARRPLTTREMAMALGISVRSNSRTRAEAGLDLHQLESKLRNLCGLFVFVNNSKVYLIHQTARDYLINEAVSNHPLSAYSCNLDTVEDQMAYICLRYLSMEGLDNVHNDDSQTRPDPSSFLEYSAIYWADHVRGMSLSAELEASNLMDHIYTTKADQFSPWFSIFWKHYKGSGTVPTLDVIHLAALNGHRNVIAHLLADGQVDPNVADTAGSYPLTYASSKGHYDVALLLIEYGAHVNARDECYSNALLTACADGHHHIVRMLLEHGADPNDGKKLDQSVLQYACMFGNINTVETLLIYGADANASGVLSAAVFSACCRGDVELLQILMKYGAIINHQIQDNGTGFFMACSARNAQVMKFLLEHGASESCDFAPVLTQACSAGNVEILQLLLDHISDTNTSDTAYAFCLDAACYNGNDEVLRILLEHRATSITRHKLNDSLRLSCINGHVSIVQILLSYGADFDNEDKENPTALQIACSNGNEDFVNMLLAHGADVNAQSGPAGHALRVACSAGHEKIVDILLAHGADVNAPGGCSVKNALHDACSEGHNKIVHMLLNHGADANANCEPIGNALRIACANGHEKIVHMLLSYGADINAPAGRSGGNALHAASLVGDVEIARTLLAHGADINARDSDGWSAMKYACLRGHDRVVEILLRYGADANALDGDGQSLLKCACLGNNDKILRILLKYQVNRGPEDIKSALESAIFAGDDRIVRTLLKFGAKLKSEDCLSILKSACFEGHNKIVYTLLTHEPAIEDEDCQKALRAACSKGHHKVVQVLLNYGTDVNSEYCRDTLELACFKGHDKTVQRLLNHGVQIKVEGYLGAVYSACRNGHNKVLHILLDHGVTHTKSETLQIALRTACYSGQDETVRMLLEHGVDINAASFFELSALQIARFKQHEKIIQILLEHGARESFFEILERRRALVVFLSCCGYCALLIFYLT